MQKARLIYIGKPGSAVFESQVIQILIEIKSKNIFDEVILLAGIESSGDSNMINDLIKRTGLRVETFKKYPNYHFFREFQKKALSKSLTKLLCENVIIHTRGETFSQVIKPIVDKTKYKSVKILTDVRGAIYEETLFYKKMKAIPFQLKLYQHKKNLKVLSKNTDFISCVSEKLKSYVLDRVNIEEEKVGINPCSASELFFYSSKSREEFRQKLKIKNTDKVFIFATGGNDNWQNTGEIIKSIASKGFRVLNLSRSKIEVENVINLFVPYSDVPKYLNSADVAVVWRKNDIVNNVASPVKFSEYACCGLPIVSNRGVNLITDYIENSKNGLLIDSFDELSSSVVDNLISIDRNQISKNAKMKFSSTVIIENYLKMYSQLLKS